MCDLDISETGVRPALGDAILDSPVERIEGTGDFFGNSGSPEVDRNESCVTQSF